MFGREVLGGIIRYLPVPDPSGSPLKVAGREKLFQTIFSNPLGFSPFLSANKKAPFMGLCLLAERKGFEPSKPFGLHTFQACAFSRSATSLLFLNCITQC